MSSIALTVWGHFSAFFTGTGRQAHTQRHTYTHMYIYSTHLHNDTHPDSVFDVNSSGRRVQSTTPPVFLSLSSSLFSFVFNCFTSCDTSMACHATLCSHTHTQTHIMLCICVRGEPLKHAHIVTHIHVDFFLSLSLSLSLFLFHSLAAHTYKPSSLNSSFFTVSCPCLLSGLVCVTVSAYG